jgi:hypothetical protein
VARKWKEGSVLRQIKTTHPVSTIQDNNLLNSLIRTDILGGALNLILPFSIDNPPLKGSDVNLRPNRSRA